MKNHTCDRRFISKNLKPEPVIVYGSVFDEDVSSFLLAPGNHFSEYTAIYIEYEPFEQFSMEKNIDCITSDLSFIWSNKIL